jgi:hypothetical protein
MDNLKVEDSHRIIHDYTEDLSSRVNNNVV